MYALYIVCVCMYIYLYLYTHVEDTYTCEYSIAYALRLYLPLWEAFQ